MDPIDEMVAAAMAGVSVDAWRAREARRAARIAENQARIEAWHRMFRIEADGADDDDDPDNA